MSSKKSWDIKNREISQKKQQIKQPTLKSLNEYNNSIVYIFQNTLKLKNKSK